MTKSIEHIFPAIGRQSINLFGQTQDLYNWMEEGKIINRLANNPQLGVANIHFPEFRHTRLDYTYLTLKIIDILSKHSAEFGFNLSTPKKYTIGKTVYNWTGAEVVQCWSLLLNMGHTHGTFYSEFILHRHFNKHWKDISKNLTRQWAKSLGKEILDNSDYRFHQLLTLFELETLPSHSQLYKPFVGLLGIYSGSSLKNMGVKVPSSTEYLRQIYRVVRYIAFLSLDSHYSRCPFGIALPKLMSILPTFIYKTLDGDKGITAQLSSLDYWMSSHYYSSPISIITMLNNIHSLDRNFSKSIKRSLESEDNNFLELVKSWKKTTKSITPSNDWIHVIRVAIDEKLNNLNDKQLFPVNIQAPSQNPEYRLSVVNVASGTYYLDIFAKHTPDPYRVLRLIPQSGLFNIFSRLKEDKKYCYSDIKDTSTQYRERWRIVRHNCADHLYAYTSTVFKLLADKEEVVQFKPFKTKGLGWLFCSSKKELDIDIKEYIDSDFKDYVDSVSEEEGEIRKKELQFTHEVILKHLKHWESVIVYTGNVSVYNPKKGAHHTDIDGIAFLLKDNSVRFLLLQSKKTRKRGLAQSKKWFKNKIKPLLPQIKGRGKHRVHEYKNGIAISIDFN